MNDKKTGEAKNCPASVIFNLQLQSKYARRKKPKLKCGGRKEEHSAPIFNVRKFRKTCSYDKAKVK